MTSVRTAGHRALNYWTLCRTTMSRTVRVTQVVAVTVTAPVTVWAQYQLVNNDAQM